MLRINHNQYDQKYSPRTKNTILIKKHILNVLQYNDIEIFRRKYFATNKKWQKQ